MRKYCWLLLFLLSCNPLFAQRKELDSLLQVLQRHQVNDSIRLNILLDIAYDYNLIDPSEGLKTADSAIALARLLDKPSRLATAYNYKGLNYAAQGDDTLALKYYFKGLDICHQLQDNNQMAIAFHNIGISYFNLANYPGALNYQQQAAAIFDSLGRRQGLAGALNSTGVVYLSVGDYPKALDYYLKALRLYEEMNDKQKIGNIFTNIGLVYDHLNNYPKALEYHFKARDLSERSGDQYGLQNTLGNIGNTYDNSGNPEKALASYHQALEINNRLHNNRGIANDLTNIGIVYYGMSEYSKALDHLQKAISLYQQLNNKQGLPIAYTYLSATYYNLPVKALAQNGISPSQRFVTAVAFQKKGLRLSEQTGDVNSQSEAWGNLGDMYEKEKDYANALEAYKNHILLRDSILNNDKKSTIARLEMQYDFDKKEAIARAESDKQQAIAAAELNRQRTMRNSFAGGAAVLLFAAAFSFFFYKKKRDAEEQKKEAEFQVQVANTEMKALRSQMNPHFIFNSLNSISDYIARHDIQTADYYLTRFAKLMRMILENSEQREIPLAEDLKALEAYMQLEALRLNHQFTYEIKIDETIDLETTLVPPLILQPFVENSIWHGIARKKGKGRILIAIRKEAGMINCIVEDNGAGRKEATQAEKKSLGMKITRSRIDIINKIKGSKAGVELSDLAEGIRVEVKLPLELSF